jgi:uncharacterized protein (DUF58 family)
VARSEPRATAAAPAAPARPPAVLDPAVLDKLGGLCFVSRGLVEGFRAGTHRSGRRGSSAEFAQHREYVPGDETRRLDWKVFARSDRLVVKEFFEESNLDCHLLVDCSESMRFKSLGWSKLDWARWCAAALAHLVLAQGDSAGLVLFAGSERVKLPPASGQAQRAAIFARLEAANAAGETGVGALLEWLAGRLRRRGVAVLVSDFFDEPAGIEAGLQRLAHQGTEVIAVQVLDPQELAFDYDGLLALEGLEGAGRLKVDPRALREAYQREIEAHSAAIARAARALSFDFLRADTAQALDQVLWTYLARRAARARVHRGRGGAGGATRG